MEYLVTEQMKVGYGKKTIVEDINIRMHRGEIVTLLGPNGVGKSTILKSLTKQLSLMGGVCIIDQKNLKVWDERGLSKKLSMVTTDRIQGEYFTCMDIVQMGRYPYTGRLGVLSKEDHKKVLEAIALVDMETYKDVPYESLSDGQKQRVLLAKAICQEPEILILDEPASYLDIRYKIELATILKRLAKEKNMAIVMALHELDLAQRISDIVVCIKDGIIDRFGSPEEIYTSDYISSLYDMPKGSFHVEGGIVELARVEGCAKAFVIGGAGSGIPIYHALWRKQIPFSAGVLHEHDVEMHIASALAQTVVSETAFECISDEHYNRAKQLMDTCSYVLCSIERFGAMNQKNKLLLDYAIAQDLLIDVNKL